MGQLEDDKDDYLTWHGKTGDKSYQEIQNILFDYDYQNYEARFLNDQNDWELFENDLVFTGSQGFCKQLKNISSGSKFIKTSEKSFLYLVDSFR